MESEINLKTYRQLLTERNGKKFTEDEVIKFLRQLLPQIESRHCQGSLDGKLSLDTLALSGDRIIWISDSITRTKASITQYIYDLGICVIELLTAKPYRELQALDGSWTWEDECFISDEFTHTIVQMLEDFPQHRFQSANAVLLAIDSRTISPATPKHSPPILSQNSHPEIPIILPVNEIASVNNTDIHEAEFAEVQPQLLSNQPSRPRLPTEPIEKVIITATSEPSNSDLATWQLGLIGLTSMLAATGGGLGVWKWLQPDAAIFSFLGGANSSVATTRNNPLFPIQKDGKRGYIDRSGKLVVKPSLSMNLVIKENNIVDVDGRCSANEISDTISVPPQFKKSANFHDDLAPIEVNGKCGFINNKGKVAILPKFDDASFFSEELAAVKVENKYGYIDRSGQVAINPQFAMARSFSDGLATVAVGNKYGFIDRKGQLVINPQFDWAGDFTDGVAAIKEDGKFGYIDRTGKILISPTFDSLTPFSGGFAVVETNNQWGYIGKVGEYIIQPQFAKLSSFSEGVAVACTENSGNTCGYVDRTGKFMVNPKFNGGQHFSDGLAAVNIDNQWGYIDKNGKFIINPRFSWAGDFNAGLALVKVNEKWGYIDKSGKFIWQPSI
jgi:WG containing repeat